MSEQETIIRAAIKVGDEVHHLASPARHHNILHQLKCNVPGHDQGFLTSSGRFVDRLEAMKIATDAGQVKRRPGGYNSPELFSEDLW